jgi:hypothetical protein
MSKSTPSKQQLQKDVGLPSEKLKVIVDHFESAVEMSNDVKLVKVLARNARDESVWSEIVEQLRGKRKVRVDLNAEPNLCVE